MRAITVSEFGPPSVLVPAEVATPTPAPGEVLIEVTGAGVGPWDVKMRQGLFGPQDFPYIPGAEVSGLVTALGDASTRFSIGEPVYGRAGFTGGYAEYAVVDATAVCAAPDGLDLEAAGAVPVGGGTAIEGIDEHLHLRGGDSVLVAGAAGGVGLFVVQIAKARGAVGRRDREPREPRLPAQPRRGRGPRLPRRLDRPGPRRRRRVRLRRWADLGRLRRGRPRRRARRDHHVLRSAGRARRCHRQRLPGRGDRRSPRRGGSPRRRWGGPSRDPGADPARRRRPRHGIVEGGHVRGKLVLIPG